MDCRHVATLRHEEAIASLIVSGEVAIRQIFPKLPHYIWGNEKVWGENGKGERRRKKEREERGEWGGRVRRKRKGRG